MISLDGWLWKIKKKKHDIIRITGKTRENPKYRQEHKNFKRVQMS